MDEGSRRDAVMDGTFDRTVAIAPGAPVGEGRGYARRSYRRDEWPGESRRGGVAPEDNFVERLDLRAPPRAEIFFDRGVRRVERDFLRGKYFLENLKRESLDDRFAADQAGGLDTVISGGKIDGKRE